MAVTSTNHSRIFVGDGAQREFPLDFPVPYAESLVVSAALPGQDAVRFVYQEDYTVSLTHDAEGFPVSAVVTTAEPVASGMLLTIARELVIVQGKRLISQGGYFPDTLEKALDYLTMALQQMDTGAALDAVEKLQAEVSEAGNEIMALDIAIQQEAATRASEDATLRTETAGKANLTHAAQHAASGTDPISPADIEAMPVAPSDGKEYHAKGNGWAEVGPVSGLPEGGQPGDIIVNTGPGEGEWQAAKASASDYGLAKVDGTTIVASNGVLTAVGGGGGEGGTTDHRALSNRDAVGSHPGTAISIAGDEANPDAQTAIDALRLDVVTKADAEETAQAIAQKADASALANYATTDALNAGLANKADAVDLRDMAYADDAPADGKTYGRKDGAWAEASGGGGESFPWLIGQVIQYLGPLPDASILEPYYLVADGSEVSREDYPELFAAYGTVYGAGDGVTSFGLPDLRGMFMRGLDNGRGVDPGRVLGEFQGDAIRNFTGSIYMTKLGAAGTTGAFRWDNAGSSGPSSNASWQIGTMTLDPSRVVPTADENRPVSMPCNYLIMAKSPAIASSDDFTAAINAVNTGLNSRLDIATYETNRAADAFGIAKVLARVDLNGTITVSKGVVSCVRTSVGVYVLTLANGLFSNVENMIAIGQMTREDIYGTALNIRPSEMTTTRVVVRTFQTSGSALDNLGFALSILEL